MTRLCEILDFCTLRTGFACGAFAVRFWTRVALGRPIMLIVSQRYSYLACGPRVACKVCGKTATAQVKESGSTTFGGPPAAWSLHCGACRTSLMTTVFERLDNPFFRGLSEKSREQYEKKRRKVEQWLLAGWPETQERVRTNNLIGGGAWTHKRHLAYLKRQVPELLHFTAESAT
jgi:hypothetical protein